VAAGLPIGAGAAVEVVLSTGLCEVAVETSLEGAGLALVSGLALAGRALVVLVTRLGELFVVLLMLGSGGGDAAGALVFADALSVAAGKGVSTAAFVLATFMGDAAFDSATLLVTFAGIGAGSVFLR
jgi:hypothetical protein